MQYKIIRRYIGPYDSIDKIKEISEEIKKMGKELMIAELQAEPWENGELVSKSDFPPSFRPEDFQKNLNYASKFNPSIVLFWGFEYWLWKKENGNSAYWNEAKKTIKNFEK